MPKFLVPLFDITPVTVEVEAADQEAANDAAEGGEGAVVGSEPSKRLLNPKRKSDATSSKELAKNIREFLFE